jgi:alpha-galactosidase
VSRRRWLAVAAAAVAAATGLAGWSTVPVHAAADGAAVRPVMGWSSWSFYRGPATEAKILAQAAVMRGRLQQHGYVYLNIDAGWSDHVDQYGRDRWDPSLFPDGIPRLALKLHAMGLKLGLYLNPGIRQSVVSANLPILGTRLHARDIADTSQIGNTLGCCYWRIDYSKPGAYEYIQSYVDMFASWGVDYVKMDFVGPGGGRAPADNRPDMQAWNQAIARSGRPMVLELSNSLSFANAAVWKQYANGWRIDGDIECYHCGAPGSSYPLTSWTRVLRRFADLPKWTPFAGPGGWNDLDALELGNGDNDGLTPDQRRSAMTLWSIGCAPLILGADLTHLDPADLPIMTNDEVIAVNQAGVSGRLIAGTPTGPTQVWAAREPDGSYAVALFNLASSGTAPVSVSWQQLGLSRTAEVRDLWAHTNLGTFVDGFAATLAPGASRLIRVTRIGGRAAGHQDRVPVRAPAQSAG